MGTPTAGRGPSPPRPVTLPLLGNYSRTRQQQRFISKLSMATSKSPIIHGRAQSELVYMISEDQHKGCPVLPSTMSPKRPGAAQELHPNKTRQVE
jgi:hypothetical protein